MNESHNIETLEKLPMQRLKTLLRKYMSKGTKAARKEASTVKRIMGSRKMSYNEARELVEAALGEMAQTPARRKQMRDQLDAEKKDHTVTPKRKRRTEWTDSIERKSGWTYDIDGKKVKKPKAVDPAKEAHRKKSSEDRAKRYIKESDPNRGAEGRAKPKLPRGVDPYDLYAKGEIKSTGGKTRKRIASLSDEGRARYYREVGIRSRAASRGGRTGRLFPMSEMAQSSARVRQMDRRVSKPNLSREELDAIDKTNKRERNSKNLFGKGGRKLKRVPSVTRGDYFG
jgi:hypothetical protein